jgi:hypothetical protein
MRTINNLAILVLATLLCLPLAAKGQENTGTEQPAQGVPSTPSGQTNQVPQEEQVTPPSSDARAFLGTEEFSPGGLGLGRGYFIPSLQFTEMTDSNFRVRTGTQRFETINTVVGRLSFQKIGRHFQTTGDYRGGGQLYNNHSELNTSMHQFGITQSFQWRRWSLGLDDRATYLPESQFGFGGFGFAGSLGPSLGGAFGTNLGNLNPAFNPSESFLTGRGSRVQNTVALQVKYLVGRRSALSFAGSYGILHFRSPGFTNTENYFSEVGYSRSLTARDYLGISYGFGLFKLHTTIPTFQTHLVQVSYGHRISGRLSVKVGAGPQINTFQRALSGSTTSTSWSALTSLDYAFRRGQLSGTYSRHTTDGGGVLSGSTSDIVTVGLSSPLSRHWTISLNPGYSHNRTLPQTSAGNIVRTFDSVHLGTSLSRSLGPFMSMFFTYNYQTQRSDAIPCVTTNCGTTLLRHVIGFGFDWHPRQIVVN